MFIRIMMLGIITQVCVHSYAGDIPLEEVVVDEGERSKHYHIDYIPKDTLTYILEYDIVRDPEDAGRLCAVCKTWNTSINNKDFISRIIAYNPEHYPKVLKLAMYKEMISKPLLSYNDDDENNSTETIDTDHALTKPRSIQSIVGKKCCLIGCPALAIVGGGIGAGLGALSSVQTLGPILIGAGTGFVGLPILVTFYCCYSNRLDLLE
jgi:hypothetical protein